VDFLNAVVAERYFEQLLAWLGRRAEDEPEWQEAAHFGDTVVYVTAEELTALGTQLDELLETYSERARTGEGRPPDARRVSFLHLAFPTDNPTAKG